MAEICQPRIDAAAERSGLVGEALSLARQAHAGQVRNGAGGMPYIEHPRMVAELLAEHGKDGEAVLAAALLHDTVEDSEVTVEQLRARFGEPVATMVALLSDDESIDSFTERKAEHRVRVRAADPDTFAIYAADKLTNVRTLRRAYAERGEAITAEFSVPLEQKVDSWEADCALLEELAPTIPYLGELREQLTLLRADRSPAAPHPGT